MKRKYSYRAGSKTVEREYNYIPVRYILAILISVIEVAAVIGIVVLLCYYLPYFYILAFLTQVFCVINIVSSDDNPDYKLPWLLCVMALPVVGFMLYFMFYSRKLKRKYIKRLDELKRYSVKKDDGDELSELERKDPYAASTMKMLGRISGAHIYKNEGIEYFTDGKYMWERLLVDLDGARSYIFMEYFIIEEGEFWNSVLEILKRKASEGVTVRVIYDDIGCMSTLPGGYDKQLRSFGIEAVSFARLRGNADSSFNNRSHRKITVIDGRVGYTGGVNIADEYVDRRARFGYWKDTAARIEGSAVDELTSLFLWDFGINSRALPPIPEPLSTDAPRKDEKGYIMPFGDGPRPIYEQRVAKSAIANMLSGAVDYAYMTTPYLIIDNELTRIIESAAMRGVDVRIIVPHVPDKRMVFKITRSSYKRLMAAGVRIFEYTPGFIHAKSYIADDKYALIGTANLDYRSLVHNFENGLFTYGTPLTAKIKEDFLATLAVSEEIDKESLHVRAPERLLRAVLRIFAPML